jgi:formate hydrogenlyase subunit 3/multisubunit Na+/H+ antiporter MnhD subunit
MGLLKALLIAVLAAIGVASVAQNLEGKLGDWLRLYNLHLELSGLHFYFSIPIFIGVALFSWIFLFWSRE